ncbi:Required for respiratory growth protein 9 mitochondrial [Toensbergia leucococca]|nr:Required for respiratory growth protein 9 mitochondrial [Toensbergia leucococca]
MPCPACSGTILRLFLRNFAVEYSGVNCILRSCPSRIASGHSFHTQTSLRLRSSLHDEADLNFSRLIVSKKSGDAYVPFNKTISESIIPSNYSPGVMWNAVVPSDLERSAEVAGKAGDSANEIAGTRPAVFINRSEPHDEIKDATFSCNLNHTHNQTSLKKHVDSGKDSRASEDNEGSHMKVVESQLTEVPYNLYRENDSDSAKATRRATSSSRNIKRFSTRTKSVSRPGSQKDQYFKLLGSSNQETQTESPTRLYAISSATHETRAGKLPREPWQIQKKALTEKFGSQGWSPRKRLSPDALEGIRTLHAQFPDKYTTPVLAEQFQVSPEAVRRILKSKWKPNETEEESRRRRWDKRGETIWGQMVEIGIKPPKKWREMGIGTQKDVSILQRQRRDTVITPFIRNSLALRGSLSNTGKTSGTQHESSLDEPLSERIL